MIDHINATINLVQSDWLHTSGRHTTGWFLVLVCLINYFKLLSRYVNILCIFFKAPSKYQTSQIAIRFITISHSHLDNLRLFSYWYYCGKVWIVETTSVYWRELSNQMTIRLDAFLSLWFNKLLFVHLKKTFYKTLSRSHHKMILNDTQWSIAKLFYLGLWTPFPCIRRAILIHYWHHLQRIF